MGKKIFSGVQPTGNLHLGNYLGAIKNFVDFWNIKNYVLMFNNGQYQKSNQFHIKIKINEGMANRMRRDHFARIKMQRQYEPANQPAEHPQVPQEPYANKDSFKSMLEKEPEGLPQDKIPNNGRAAGIDDEDFSMASAIKEII